MPGGDDLGTSTRGCPCGVGGGEIVCIPPGVPGLGPERVMACGSDLAGSAIRRPDGEFCEVVVVGRVDGVASTQRWLLEPASCRCPRRRLCWRDGQLPWWGRTSTSRSAAPSTRCPARHH